MNVKNEIQGGTCLADDARQQVLALWEQNRTRCAWFMRSDFVPDTTDDFKRCLQTLAQHGDRATYVMARKLMKCL